MRILVLGAGAVGGYFGGRLAEASRDVTFLVRPPRAGTLAERGLPVSSPLGDFHVSVKVTTADQLEGPYDLIILAAKQYDLDAAIAAIGPAVGSQTTILPLLNGLVHLDRLDGTFGPVSVLGGVAYIGASLTADGGIRHHNRLSGIAFGERGGGKSDRVRAIAAEFSDTPVSAPGEDNVLLDMWEKFVMITAMAGMNCLMRGNIGEIAATEDGADLMREFLGECGAIATAAGFAPRPEYLGRIVPMLTAKGSVDSASMRTDLDAVRRTESDAILGDMLDRARRLGVTTPLLRAARCHMQVYENRLSK